MTLLGKIWIFTFPFYYIYLTFMLWFKRNDKSEVSWQLLSTWVVFFHWILTHSYWSHYSEDYFVLLLESYCSKVTVLFLSWVQFLAPLSTSEDNMLQYCLKSCSLDMSNTEGDETWSTIEKTKTKKKKDFNISSWYLPFKSHKPHRCWAALPSPDQCLSSPGVFVSLSPRPVPPDRPPYHRTNPGQAALQESEKHKVFKSCGWNTPVINKKRWRHHKHNTLLMRVIA